MFEPFFIPDDWTEEDGYTIAMFCVPNSVKWRTAVFSAINLLSFGRTWDAGTGNIKNAQEIAEGILVSYMANCNDFFAQMTAALQTLAQVQLTIAQAGNCGCETVGTETEPTGDDGTPETGPGTPWPDEEDYFDYRCKAAGEIIRRITQSIHILQDYTEGSYFGAAITLITSALTAALTAAGLGPLLAQLGWLATIAGALVADELIDLDAIDDLLTNSFDSLLCELYEGSSAQQSKDNFVAFLEGSSLNAASVAFLQLFLTNGVLNWMWQYEEKIAVAPTVYDCESCNAPCLEYQVMSEAEGGKGPVSDLGGGSFQMQGELASDGKYRCGVAFNVYPDRSASCGPYKTVTYAGGTTTFENSIGVRTWLDGAGGFPNTTLDYQATTIWSGGKVCRQIVLRSNSPFQTTFTST